MDRYHGVKPLDGGVSLRRNNKLGISQNEEKVYCTFTHPDKTMNE